MNQNDDPGTTEPAPVVVINQGVGDYPTKMHCPICQKQVLTAVLKEPGLATWLSCGAIVFFQGWICCLCLIPFCIDSFKDTVHHCPSCAAVVGKRKVLNL